MHCYACRPDSGTADWLRRKLAALVGADGSCRSDWLSQRAVVSLYQTDGAIVFTAAAVDGCEADALPALGRAFSLVQAQSASSRPLTVWMLSVGTGGPRSTTPIQLPPTTPPTVTKTTTTYKASDDHDR